MNTRTIKILSMIVSLILVIHMGNLHIYASSLESNQGENQLDTNSNKTELKKNIELISQFVIKEIPEPTIGTLGGDWSVFGMARSIEGISEAYKEKYIAHVIQELTDSQGELHQKNTQNIQGLLLA